MNRPYRIALDLFNAMSTPKRIWVEPWAEELTLPPGIGWRFVCDAVSLDPIPVEFHEDSIVVYGLPKSIVRIFQDDRLVWECHEPFDPPQ